MLEQKDKVVIDNLRNTGLDFKVISSFVMFVSVVILLIRIFLAILVVFTILQTSVCKGLRRFIMLLAFISACLVTIEDDNFLLAALG